MKTKSLEPVLETLIESLDTEPGGQWYDYDNTAGIGKPCNVKDGDGIIHIHCTKVHTGTGEMHITVKEDGKIKVSTCGNHILQDVIFLPLPVTLIPI